VPKSKKRTPRPTGTKSAKQQNAKPLSRRGALKRVGLYTGGAVVLAACGAAFARDFQVKLAEGDLTKIGRGKPTIVQIHDPSCQLCRALQRETRAALADCDESYDYLVANVKTQQGAEFQRRMGQPHVTLALLNGDGTPLHFVNGVTPAETLKATFGRVFG